MRLAIIGNSGSGKSTLARWIASASGAPSLDLDTVYWEADRPGVAREPAAARADLEAYCGANEHWVIEGCYASLAAAAFPWRPLLVLLNPGEAQCLANCRARAWEPHKYPSKAAQDERLAPLLAWVSDYYQRSGEMSLQDHRALLAAYAGPKLEVTATMPVSIKGVLFDPQERCVLALNDRDEWELPGGRIEIGETPEECLAREFEEELGVRIEVRRRLDSYLFEVIPGRHVFIATYGCALVGEAFAPVVSHEHRCIDSFPMGSLPQNLPAGYRRSIEAWHAAR